MARETMDPELVSACKYGDVEKLKKLCETRDDEFFLARQASTKRNMLHVTFHKYKQRNSKNIIKKSQNSSFIGEALNRLPNQVVRQLICQVDEHGNNPLHEAACNKEDTDAVKLLVDEYKSTPSDGDQFSGEKQFFKAETERAKQTKPSCPPWRAKNEKGKVPVEVAISSKSDKVAAFLMSLDPDIFNFLPRDELLRESILKGCIRTVKEIFTSNQQCSIKGFDPCRIKKESNESCISLLRYHPEIAKDLDHSGKIAVLDRATKKGVSDVVTTILNIDISLLFDSHNLLYTAVNKGHLQIAHLILDAFNKSREQRAQKERSFDIENEEDIKLSSFQPLWSLPYRDTRETPLLVAFCKRDSRLAADMLYSDFALLSDLADLCDENPEIIPATEQQRFKDFIEDEMKQDEDKNWIMNVYVKAILRFLEKNSDDNKSRKLIKLLPNLIRFKDASGRQMLQYLLDENKVDGMSLLLKIHPSAIETPNGEPVHLFIRAYRNGNLSAIRAICELFPSCPQAATDLENQSTILHNVKLPGLEEYRSLLRIQGIAKLKKNLDASRRQPLIKAIDEDNIYLSAALLEMDDIDAMDIKSPDGKRAAVLLKDKAKGSVAWANLYMNYVKRETSYLQLDTNLNEMRNTLSVVAALLATITFAAAFTIPGGFDQNNGDVLLGRRASFIVFILSDTYAMCCSMIVLCSLVWSMVADSEEKARLMIDRSVVVLLQSLYGTFVAYMTGVYTMMSRKTPWVAIVVCVISSCVCVISSYIPIIANNWKDLVTVFYNVFPTLRPKNSPPRPAKSSSDPPSSDETSTGPSAISVQY